jgi:uncharacterized protein (TIGR03437 family)
MSDSISNNSKMTNVSEGRARVVLLCVLAFAAASALILFRVRAQQGDTPMWTSIGPMPLGYQAAPTNPTNFNSGRVSSIAVDPNDPNHWLIGAGNGGVWETRDGGSNWIPLSDTWPTLSIGAIAFAPSNPSIIYVGTGEPDAGAGGAVGQTGLGIMKSADGGKTWNLIAASTFARGTVKRIRVHPTDPNIVLAGTSRGSFGRDSQEGAPSPPPFGVLKSTDGGVNWVRTLNGQVTALEIDPTNFNRQFAAIGEQRINGVNNDSADSASNGLYRSTDGGQTWNVIVGPWGASTKTRATVGRVELAISESNPNVLYASIQISPNGGSSALGLLGLYRTDNAWDATPSWIQISVAPTGIGAYCGPNKCGYSHVISVDPSDSNTLFAGGGDQNGFWRCTNCGAAPVWTRIDGVHPDPHATAWVGTRFILGNDGGVWSTTDLGNTWRDHNATLSTAMFFSAALHPTDSKFILGGLRDFAISLRTASNIWAIFPQPSPTREWGEAEVAVSSSRPDTDWVANHCCADGTISRTTDGGKTSIQADAGIDKTGAAFVAPVRKCPSNDDVFLTGSNRVWRTDSFFSSTVPSWVANGPVLTGQNGGPSTFSSPPASVLEVEFVASDTTCNSYALGNRGGQVQLTRDGGKTWTDLNPDKSLPPRPINGLAFDPTNPNILYAALSNFDDATPGKSGHVFKTTNALSASPTWVNASPPLNEPFNVIRVDPSNPKRIYAGSDTGLWRSTDGAATWVHDGPQAGLPNAAAIFDIKINPKTGVTAVFTYGRGAYAIGVPQGPQLISSLRSPANGATYISGGLVPGSWAQVQGTNLSSVTRTWNNADFAGLGSSQLPTRLEGVEVKVNGVSAAVYYVSPTQVSFQVPSGILAGSPGFVLVSSPVTVQLFRDGVGGNILATTGISNSPGIFPISVNGKNYPAGVFSPDGKITGDPAAGAVFRKARPGDAIQLYATGLTRVTGGVWPTSQTVTGVTVKIGDISFTPEFAGLVAVGEFQINFKVPQQFANLPEGDYPISIQVGLDDGAVTSSPAAINSDPPGPVVLPIQH